MKMTLEDSPMGMALDTSNHSHSYHPQNNKSREVVVYIVQRSWYAGPPTTPPVDYRRLLVSRTAADQVAYHSAHQWASTHRQSAAPATVSTLQLPDGSFGFLAANQLFWVRSVTAQATGTVDSSMYTGTGSTISNPNTQHFHEAHCLLSPDGTLLGGTQSRRAALATEPHCIFVGHQSSHAALQWLMVIQQQEQQQQRTIQWVPVGPPPTPDDIDMEWPDTTKKRTTTTTTTATRTLLSKRRCAENDDPDADTSNAAGNSLWFGGGSASNYRKSSCKRQSGMMRRPISFVDGEVTAPIMSNHNNNDASSSSNGIQMMMLE